MDSLGFGTACTQLVKSSSLTDLKAVLFQKDQDLDRGPVVSENKYDKKVLVGNWLERRAVQDPQTHDWRTVYEIDYKTHPNNAWKDNQDAQWANKLNIEGLPKEILFDSHGKQFFDNMATCTDLKYNILQKNWTGQKLKTYNTRKLEWIPQEDLAESYGNVTQFGLRDMLRIKWYEESEERVEKCRWQTIHKMEFRKPPHTFDQKYEKYEYMLNFIKKGVTSDHS